MKNHTPLFALPSVHGGRRSRPETGAEGLEATLFRLAGHLPGGLRGEGEPWRPRIMVWVESKYPKVALVNGKVD